MDIQNNLKLSIVFLNYNRVSETRYTVEWLKKLLQHRQDVEVIAIDNGSTDGTKDFLQDQTWLHSIILDSNTGIAGYNLGFEQAKGDYILVLDDDSHPIDNHTLDRIIQRLEAQSEIGIIACQIESPDGKPVCTWHLPQNNRSGISMAFVGCGFAIRRQLFKQVGWYPEEFFLYQNEIEVAIRVAKLGYQIHYDSQCRVVHRHSPQGRSNWRRVYYPTRNTIWIIRRYFPYPIAAYLITSRLCIGLIRAIQSKEFKWYYKAVKEAFNLPIQRQILSTNLQKTFEPFYQQNSLWHQLMMRF